MEDLDHFTRDNPADYFNYITNHRQGVMEVYLKDNNGHPGSPINGSLNGLFFSAGRVPSNPSLFGDKRFLVPVKLLLKEGNTNLYFADFYCNNSAHYVTVVMTTPSTEADIFLHKNAIE